MAYVFDAELVDYPDVGARIALGGTDTLESLHELLREAFGWTDPHLYSFWLDGEFWGDPESEYTAPDELEPGQQSAAVAVGELEFEPGGQIAYVFDFGDSWNVLLTLAGIEDVNPPLPRIVDRWGEPPPQYREAAYDYDYFELGGSE
jgi:shikimate kinase